MALHVFKTNAYEDAVLCIDEESSAKDAFFMSESMFGEMLQDITAAFGDVIIQRPYEFVL